MPTMSTNMSTEKTNKKSISPLVVLVLIVLTVVSASLAMYYRQKAVYASKSVSGDPEALQREVNALLEKVGKLIVLPATEKPVIATVTEPEKLSGQPFFANAKLGDKVFIYTESRKAILYSPTLNKIIEVAPLSIGQPTPEAVPAEEVQE